MMEESMEESVIDNESPSKDETEVRHLQSQLDKYRQKM